MTSGRPAVSPGSATSRDHLDTVIEKWRGGEALTVKAAISQPEPASAPAAERGLMTCQPSGEDGLPPHLAADAALCGRLVMQGCSGGEWELFVASLYRKATRVTYRWLIEGRMFAECSKIGRIVAPGDIAEWNREDVRSLAHEVVQETFSLFQKQLLDRKYDASRGATLFTYFMNAVARQFPNAFRRTINGRRLWHNRVDLYDDASNYDQPDLDDYHQAHARYAALLFELIAKISSSRQRWAAWLSFVEGQGNEQIARRLDVSPDAARALVNRARITMQSTYLQQRGEKGGRL